MDPFLIILGVVVVLAGVIVVVLKHKSTVASAPTALKLEAQRGGQSRVSIVGTDHVVTVTPVATPTPVPVIPFTQKNDLGGGFGGFVTGSVDTTDSARFNDPTLTNIGKTMGQIYWDANESAKYASANGNYVIQQWTSRADKTSPGGYTDGTGWHPSTLGVTGSL
jgi:hypothetical protein